MAQMIRLTIAAAALASIAMPAWAQSIEETCKKAESEPPLMWYSSQDPALNARVVKSFSEAYPKIRTESFRLPSGALAARYSSERDAGVINADLVSIADAKFQDIGLGKGWFIDAPKADFPAMAKLEDRFFKQGIALTGISPSGITYNTGMVNGQPPKEWKDLLRPEFKGKIALADPRNVPTFMALFRILRQELGDDFLKAFAAQQPVIVSSAVPGTQQMAAGEFAIVFPNTLTVVEQVKEKGGAVEYAMPQVTTGVEYTTMLSAGADSPNAAKCLYNFLFTTTGQEGFNGTFAVSPMPGVKGSPMPQGYRESMTTENVKTEKEILSLLNIQ